MADDRNLIALGFFIDGVKLENDGFVIKSLDIEGAVSELYTIGVTVEGPIITDTYSMIWKNAILQFAVKGEGEATYTGMITQIVLSGFVDTKTNSATYSFSLRPLLFATTLTTASRIFLDKTVPQIITDILTETGLVDGTDFELKLRGKYEPSEYTVQYQESNFDFISRMMENSGMYYFWVGAEDDVSMGQPVTAKLRITDHKDMQPVLPSPGGGGPFKYQDATIADPDDPAILQMDLIHRTAPKEILLKDYNYRKPTVDIRGKGTAEPKGLGTVYSYGEHFKTPAEGDTIAGIRGEEILCRTKVWRCVAFAIVHPGWVIEIADHPIGDFNGRYMITRVHHAGHQKGQQQGTPETVGHLLTFSAIRAETQFRPERVTPKPRIYGVMHAVVDAAASGEYAEIDDQGRYKVKVPFDLSDAKDGKASRWIRMAQPYAGAEYGMHFPLHKGIEVLLAHLDGDPDRPIIVGSAPNPDTQSPVTGKNQTQSVIHTGGGNKIVIEDVGGSQRIAMNSPTSGTYFSIGAKPAK